MAERGDDIVTVRVADNGPGIPDAQKESVFGKAEKGLESSGTGIGLYLVREIVTGYGGEIWIEDRTDTEGAVFVIEFLLAE
jgi:signal transduction histidine kinase